MRMTPWESWPARFAPTSDETRNSVFSGVAPAARKMSVATLVSRSALIEDEQAMRAIQQAIDAGVNCVDTAPGYGTGHSEEVTGRALKGRRDQVLLVTKC